MVCGFHSHSQKSKPNIQCSDYFFSVDTNYYTIHTTHNQIWSRMYSCDLLETVNQKKKLSRDKDRFTWQTNCFYLSSLFIVSPTRTWYLSFCYSLWFRFWLHRMKRREKHRHNSAKWIQSLFSPLLIGMDKVHKFHRASQLSAIIHI